jgi:DNA-binding XRE family transcriptional regulator
MKEKLTYISNNIKAYRVRSGLTQEKIANILGISRVTYNDYEVNPQKVKMETLQQIADILNCNLSDFFVKIDVTNSNINEKHHDK